MLFTKSTLLLLSSITLISAWQVDSVSDVAPKEHHTVGRGTSQCINRNHKKEDKLRFAREGSNCCLNLYKEADCNVNQPNEKKESLCREYKDKEIDFHFRSYYVDCDNRGVNNPTPTQGGDLYSPYDNRPPPPPYDYRPPPYDNRPPPPPYDYRPPPYDYRPPPYDNRPPPYDPRDPYRPNPACRPGDRCYVKDEAEAANGAGTEMEPEMA